MRDKIWRGLQNFISIYPINKSVEDEATVRIYYEGRLVPLHLTNEFIDEELAFYDAISNGKKFIESDEELKAVVKELIKTIKKDLTVDWTNHDVIRARIRANVRAILLRKGLPKKEAESILDIIIQQTTFLFKDYVPSYI